MYYDERKEVIPEAPVAPAPVVLEPWQNCLLDAARHLRTWGWCQGTSRIDERRCVQSALMHAASNDRAVYEETNQKLGVYLKLPAHYAHDGQKRYATHLWNDGYGRTEGEVIAALEGAARAV